MLNPMVQSDLVTYMVGTIVILFMQATIARKLILLEIHGRRWQKELTSIYGTPSSRDDLCYFESHLISLSIFIGVEIQWDNLLA